LNIRYRSTAEEGVGVRPENRARGKTTAEEGMYRSNRREE
jgi:hypothetical protein